MQGFEQEWELDSPERCLAVDDHAGREPRWCPGCGDHGVLSALQRLARDEQLPPEKIVVVSGIGCSSRFPHYMKTFGFHGLHGRALPVACGVRSRRPDLHLFVVTGDGDCCAIGTAHWIHAVRYNMYMTVILLDNSIYGLTKNQTSPTTPKGGRSYTHPEGVSLDPLNPLAVTLGISNVSFVAQSVDWNPVHVYATLEAAHRHHGFSFVRILQRCPHFSPDNWKHLQEDSSRIRLLTHAAGIEANELVRRQFPNRQEHDPLDRNEALALAVDEHVVSIGLFYQRSHHSYDEITTQGLDMDDAVKVRNIQDEIDRFAV